MSKREKEEKKKLTTPPAPPTMILFCFFNDADPHVRLSGSFCTDACEGLKLISSLRFATCRSVFECTNCPPPNFAIVQQMLADVPIFAASSIRMLRSKREGRPKTQAAAARVHAEMEAREAAHRAEVDKVRHTSHARPRDRFQILRIC